MISSDFVQIQYSTLGSCNVFLIMMILRNYYLFVMDFTKVIVNC